MKRSFFALASVFLMAAWITGCGAAGPSPTSSLPDRAGPATSVDSGHPSFSDRGAEVTGNLATISIAGAEVIDPTLLGSVFIEATDGRSLVITNRTQIYSQGESVPFGALEVGQVVQAQYEGQAREYLPLTPTATEIMILVPRPN